jgi:hypothetical protein
MDDAHLPRRTRRRADALALDAIAHVAPAARNSIGMRADDMARLAVETLPDADEWRVVRALMALDRADAEPATAVREWAAARAEETRECMEADDAVELECELPHWALVPHGAPGALGLMAVQSAERLG